MMLFCLFGLLFLIMATFGGKRGINAFGTLLCNAAVGILSIFLLSRHVSPIPVLLCSTFLFASLTIVMQNRLNFKTFVAFVSVIGVLFLTGTMIAVFCYGAHAEGYDEIKLAEIENNYIGFGVNLNMLSLLVIGLVWEQVGVLADAAVSISSTLFEIRAQNPAMPASRLFQSGLTVGRDILGTGINTLSFVAFGESVMLSMYYLWSGYTFAALMNSKSFFQQISGVLFSCVGCVLIIPATSAAFVRLARSEKVLRFFDRRGDGGASSPQT